MNRGIVIFAFNNRKVDYALMSLISAGFAKKNLNVPVSLITDASTLEWMKTSKIYDTASKVFDKIILTARPITDNQRRLYDGIENDVVPFVNADRCSVWDLTPYEHTLLLDSDYMVLSNQLNEYWEIDQDLLIGSAIQDIYDNKRLGYHDKYISDTGIKLYWATTVMFKKNANSKFFFDTVKHIQENYRYYADLYRFDNRQYRNDIAFSIAKHIFDGYQHCAKGDLPPVLTALDRDILVKVDKDKFTFLINYNLDKSFCAATICQQDIHIMNKQSIYRNKDQLLEII